MVDELKITEALIPPSPSVPVKTEQSIPLPDTTKKPEEPLTILEARATPTSKPEKESDDMLGAQALSHVFLETEPNQPELRLAFKAATENEHLSHDAFLADMKEKRDPDNLMADIQNNLFDYRAMVDEGKRAELGASILGDCHEAEWRAMTDQLVGALSVQERDLLLTITEEATAVRFAEVLGKPGSLTTSVGLARREWQLHKDLVTAVESRTFQANNPGATETDTAQHTDTAVRLAFGKVTLSAVGDMLKDNPKWATDALSASVKFIFNNLFASPAPAPTAL